MSTDNKTLEDIQFERELEQYRQTEEQYYKAVEAADNPTERCTAFKILIDKYLAETADALDETLLESARGNAKVNKEAKAELLEVEPEILVHLGFRILYQRTRMDEVSIQLTAVEIANDIREHIRYKKMIETIEEHKESDDGETVAKANTASKILFDGQREGKRMRKVYQAIQGWIKVPKVNWSNEMKYRMGQIIINTIVETTGLFRIEGGKETGKRDQRPQNIIIPTDEGLQILEDIHGRLDLLHPRMLPMVCPPVPWHDFKNGGLITESTTLRNPLVRTKKKDVQDVLKKGDSTILLDTINTLQAVPWVINEDVFNVAWEIWNNTPGGMGDLPLNDLDQLIAEKCPSAPWKTKKEHEKMKEKKPQVYKDFIASRARTRRQWFDELSKRLRITTTLATAKEYLGFDQFYFTYFADYRGRLYPVQTALTPQGDDLQKAIMQFAEGKMLGETGIKWWKIYGANCYGKDKLSYKDRIQWTKDNHYLMMECADNPLDGSRAWEQADKPYCFLAYCFEYKRWVETGKSEAFISHLAIAVDGSNNGLQHLSAMTRSEHGASEVNLIDSEKPADFYTTILNAASEICRKWTTDSELPAKKRAAAKQMVGKLNRKLVKRPAMTYFYSATLTGFGEQIRQEMKEQEQKLGQDLFQETEKQSKWMMSITLAEIIMQALKDTIKEPAHAMAYIQHLASCCALEDKNFEWTLPTGMTVAQAYKKSTKKRIKSFFGDIQVRITLTEETPKIDKVGVKNGASPNFVHSMDASHLQLAVQRGKKWGISAWAMIHDSFGCHAGDVETMQHAIRETFYEIYKEDILENLKEYTRSRLSGEGLEKLDTMDPIYGSLDISKVQEASYLFA